MGPVLFDFKKGTDLEFKTNLLTHLCFQYIQLHYLGCIFFFALNWSLEKSKRHLIHIEVALH